MACRVPNRTCAIHSRNPADQPPGVGKTTAIQKVVDQLGDRAGGCTRAKSAPMAAASDSRSSLWTTNRQRNQAARPAFVREQIYKATG
jgi:hypothetical protein